MVTDDYLERVYAGVLGKMIGVYLGRPFEGWTYERIMAELGEIHGYVHERLGKPLIVTDDDLTGTFTFLRALADHGCSADLTPEQIGQTWLNYIIEKRTILWWGGFGHSTEHTAFRRLKAGLPAPMSGSITQNGPIVAEQIGSQIFIDGWGMVAPGDPLLAADLARRAASVSHDGEGIYGAQVVAAMAALAFVESDLNVLLDTAVSLIPPDSTIYRLISDVRAWHAGEPDWRTARSKLASVYGYDKFGGNCHIVPNHGLIVLSLLYGENDLRRSLMIVNTSGWDTDCNSGNVGCLLGIKNGLPGLENLADLRSPLNDRLYLPTADGGRAITDALQEAYTVANTGLALQNEAPRRPKGGARFHFSLPGSVQGFRARDDQVLVSNEAAESARCLALSYTLSPDLPGLVGTDTFIPPEAIEMPFYKLLASPTLYPGQTVRAKIMADGANDRPVTVGLYVRYYGAEDRLEQILGPAKTIEAGAVWDLAWQIGERAGTPIVEIGLILRSATAVSGKIYLDYLTWEGEPDIHFQKPAHNGTMWRRAWVDAVDHYFTDFEEMFRLAQDEGRGLLIQGTRQWQNIAVSAAISPILAQQFGLAVRVQGLKRYYALLLQRNGRVDLVRMYDEAVVLASEKLAWAGDRPVAIRLQVIGHELTGWVDGKRVVTAVDPEKKLGDGGMALVVEEGCIFTNGVRVMPSDPEPQPSKGQKN